MPYELFNQIERAWLNDELGVISFEPLCCESRERGLVVGRAVFEPNAEGLDWTLEQLAHQSDNNRGVHAAAQESTEGYVSNEPAFDSLGHELPNRCFHC